jgi:hypothetical protein
VCIRPSCAAAGSAAGGSAAAQCCPQPRASSVHCSRLRCCCGQPLPCGINLAAKHTVWCSSSDVVGGREGQGANTVCLATSCNRSSPVPPTLPSPVPLSALVWTQGTPAGRP